MTIDISTLDRKALEKLKSDVEKALKSAEARALKAAKKAAEQAAAQFGFSLKEVAPEPTPASKTKRTYKKRTAAKKKGVAKYRNPNDPKQTWTGKGRQPGWFKEAMASGMDPAKLEV